MTKPIFPWPGGKRRLAKHILPLIETPHKTYVEPFAGGAAMFFMRPEPAQVEVLNDQHSELILLYRCVQHHLEELVRQFRWALVSREMFRWAQLQDTRTLTDIQRAARFYYLQKLAFGGKAAGQTFGVKKTQAPSFNLLRIEQDLSDAHLRLARVWVENLPWAECMRRYDGPETLFYLDPPYWQTAGYGVEFGIEQYELLAMAMASIAGKAILSINDHPDMRRIFADFQQQQISITYSPGLDLTQAKELLITT